MSPSDYVITHLRDLVVILNPETVQFIKARETNYAVDELSELSCTVFHSLGELRSSRRHRRLDPSEVLQLRSSIISLRLEVAQCVVKPRLGRGIAQFWEPMSGFEH